MATSVLKSKSYGKIVQKKVGEEMKRLREG
jgi:hypothetical protein